MQYPQYQQPNAPMEQPVPQQGNAAVYIAATLQSLGVSTAQFAQYAQSVGIGHAAAIQQALENGDASPLVEYVKNVAEKNPQLVQQAGSMYQRVCGTPQPTGWGGQTIERYIQ